MIITAKEAAKTAFEIATKDIVPKVQLEKIMDEIQKAVSIGKRSITFNQIILGDNLNELTKLGYSWGSGYGSDCTGYFIRW